MRQPPGNHAATVAPSRPILDVLAKLSDSLSRLKKATRPEDTRALDEEVDALQADLRQLVDLMTTYISSNRKLWEAVINLLGPMDAPDGERLIDRLIANLSLLRAAADATKQLQEIVLTHEQRAALCRRVSVAGAAWDRAAPTPCPPLGPGGARAAPAGPAPWTGVLELIVPGIDALWVRRLDQPGWSVTPRRAASSMSRATGSDPRRVSLSSGRGIRGSAPCSDSSARR